MEKGRAIVLPAYNDNLLRAMLSLKIEEREIPQLHENEVLVKMKAAPFNPSDIAFIRGGYNIIKPVPCVPGFEGTGTVVEEGSPSSGLLNKKVSCFVKADRDGTWGEYFIASNSDCIVLTESIPVEQAACLAINPLTAWGMFEHVIAKGTKAILQNAAGGQVPGLIRQLAKIHGVEVIDLVRKQEHLELLKSRGSKYVLNTGDEEFFSELEELCAQIRPEMAFDAVGGNLSGQMLNAMPESGQIIVYGALDGQMISAMDPMGIIFNKKTIAGFNLNDWIESLSRTEFENITTQIQKMIKEGTFLTEIQGTYKLDNVVQGMRSYIKSMSAGKIILTP